MLGGTRTKIRRKKGDVENPDVVLVIPSSLDVLFY
jgi:hypothetical protein